MKFPAQEVILGALLMFGAFAIGTMWSSVGPSPADELWHKLGECVTAIATIVLAGATFLLFKATNVLARLAEEDSRNRKIQATADAWLKLRPKLTGIPNLTKTSLEESVIEDKGTQARPQLRKLESFSAIVNSDVYDLETFNKISGGWFLVRVRRITPYIRLRRKRNENTYKEIVSLEAKLQSKRGQVAASDDDDDD